MLPHLLLPGSLAGGGGEACGEPRGRAPVPVKATGRPGPLRLTLAFRDARGGTPRWPARGWKPDATPALCTSPLPRALRIGHVTSTSQKGKLRPREARPSLRSHSTWVTQRVNGTAVTSALPASQAWVLSVGGYKGMTVKADSVSSACLCDSVPAAHLPEHFPQLPPPCPGYQLEVPPP